ncbi:hypothetical protein BX661DRAFT_65634 [Kickxella alabastrina]|uniref:uncharacterized protein n=1 Tax=Kickxella alabastrina TaxID=61397 RepID=UPI00221F528D|nr:uncharacterized protein BX661DRAFT_65634 [Kickxella alabastrina]KAI7833822.1 hypothetical protein BX661DRAFT_65634 [Kickxella alabastrina]
MTNSIFVRCLLLIYSLTNKLFSKHPCILALQTPLPSPTSTKQQQQQQQQHSRRIQRKHCCRHSHTAARTADKVRRDGTRNCQARQEQTTLENYVANMMASNVFT